MSYFTKTIHAIGLKCGIEIKWYKPGTTLPILDEMQQLRKKLLERHKVTLVLDVGANTGQYAKDLRSIGYAKRIVSFEPMADAFGEIAHLAESDVLWECQKIALGEVNKTTVLHVAGNSYSSSLLPMCERHMVAEPNSRYIAEETVFVATLDSLADIIIKGEDVVWLKIDVQGYEMNVIKGAIEAISRVDVIETELSFVPLYEEQPLMCDIISLLGELQFDIVLTQSNFTDPITGHVLQADGIFVRRNRETSS